MKLRIDGRFIALQALGCIACYALGVLIVFAICNVNDPVGRIHWCKLYSCHGIIFRLFLSTCNLHQ